MCPRSAVFEQEKTCIPRCEDGEIILQVALGMLVIRNDFRKSFRQSDPVVSERLSSLASRLSERSGSTGRSRNQRVN